MTGQEIGACFLGLLAVGYVVLRLVRRRRGSCCGEAECPAVKDVERRLTRARRDAERAPRG